MARMSIERRRRSTRGDLVSADMSVLSSASASRPAVHRFDLLIAEQRTLVCSAQQALQQSLSVLQGSSATKSKEEQESMQIQVETLLTRAQELLVRLQAIHKIRNELGYIQQELAEAKKAHKNVDGLHTRLRWFEHRLESLLLARRRGRPAAHGKRAGQAMRTQGRGALPPIGPSSKSTAESLDSRFEGLSDRYTKSTSIYQTNTRSVSQGSDVWHSESEANWTTVQTIKDITQSQVLSEDDKQEHVVGTPALLESPDHHQSPEARQRGAESVSRNVEELDGEGSVEGGFEGPNFFGFEMQRPSAIFGHNSWNTLTLAINSNCYEPGPKSSSPTGLLDPSNLLVLQTGLDRLCSEIDSLKSLLQAASAAAAQPGPLFPVKSQDKVLSFRRPRSRSEPLKLTLDLNNSTISGTPLSHERFPSIENITSECSQLRPSRRLYGTKTNSYPRSCGTWIDQNLSMLQSDSTSEVYLSQSLNASISPWRRQRLRSTRSRARSSKRQSTALGMDAFDVEGHRQRHIEYLCKQLKSTSLETRVDSVCALGLLKDGTKEVIDNLLSVVTEDSDFRVKYEAVKSLLLLGFFNESTLHFICSCLKLGSAKVQRDLLQLLSQENIMSFLIDKSDHELNIQALHEVLAELLNSEEDDVCLYAAAIISHLDPQQEQCIRKLHDLLESSDQHHKSMALHCLIKCCGCCSDDVISAALNQIEKLSNWQLRLTAVEDLKYIGKDLLNYEDEERKDLFSILMKMIVREPIMTVRVAIGQLLTGVGLASKAEGVLFGRLLSSNEITRGEAAIALGSFDVLKQKTIQTLVECLDLDPSSYVRVQVVRTLSRMRTYNHSIVKCIADKSRGHGMLARECAAALQNLEKRFGLA